MKRIVAGAAAFAVLVVVAGAAAGAKTYPDPVGDTGRRGGADVVSVAVSNTATAVAFRVAFASAPPLRVSTKEGWVEMLLVGVDVPPLGPPPNAKHEWPAADFALGTHGPSKTGQLVRLGEGISKESRLVARFPIVARGRTLTFAVPRRALGNPAWFRFDVAAAREGGAEGVPDFAPDRGTFRYTLSK